MCKERREEKLYRIRSGWVSSSICDRSHIASASSWPHISGLGRRLAQTGGRSGRSKRRQRLSGVSCAQRSPAGLPDPMPGMGDEIEGAIQQAAHPTRHAMEKRLFTIAPVMEITPVGVSGGLWLLVFLSIIGQALAVQRPCRLHNSRAVRLVAVMLNVAVGTSPGLRA